MTHLAALLAAASLGAMLFFSAAVTPTLFATMTPDVAGRFLRTVFPRYFLINAGVAAAAAACAAGLSRNLTAAAILAGCAVVLVLARTVMVPVINTARDRASAGDAAAKATFDRWHLASVIANLIEMAGLVTAIWLLQR
jgi:Domain of unknown function (DUF4149)